MKANAPEKLYLDPELDALTKALSEKTEDDVEYVRKDALIEWAKEHKCVIEAHGDEGDAYLRGEYSLLNSLIDKLNSM